MFAQLFLIIPRSIVRESSNVVCYSDADINARSALLAYFARLWLIFSSLGIMVHRIIGMHKHEQKVLYSLFAAFVVELVAALILGVVMAVVIGSGKIPHPSSLVIC